MDTIILAGIGVFGYTLITNRRVTMICPYCNEEVSGAEYSEVLGMCEFCAEALNEKEAIDNYWLEESGKYNEIPR